ncbi:MAG TPA: protein-glutamate O-methyltransferase CheR [Polyangiaceae bacterium]
MSRMPLLRQAPLSAEEFRLLRDIVYEHAGLHFDDDATFLFERRLSERVDALGLEGFYAYYKHLRFSPRGKAELDEMIERLVTRETYFFRQEYQLRAFRDQILPELRAQNAARRRLTIWSAGCATGEEVYTIAILVAESGLFEGWDVKIVGSDISRTSVAAARRGVYREGSFRTTPSATRQRWFYEVQDGWEVIQDLRRPCYFGQLNLMDPSHALMVSRVDAIFCRNVLIYFDVKSRKKIIESFYERLGPGGYLLLGHSESLLNLTTAFELVHLREDLVYRKPLATGRSEGIDS